MADTPKEIKQDRMYALAHRIVNGEAGHEFIYLLEEDRFYMYDNGVYRTIFEIEILALISQHIPGANKYTMAMRKQILENLKQMIFRPLAVFNRDGLLNFKSGMLDPLTGKLTAHSPSIISTIRMEYAYEPKNEGRLRCPLWDKTLLEIFEGDIDKIDVLREFFGYCLTRDTKHRKALLLLGESNCGKSTILQILRLLLGTQNCSSVPLKYISHPQYTPMLINKLANIDADVSEKAEDFEAEFKMITSGEPIHANQKFIPAFDFIPYCKIVMAANVFPRITDHSSAFYNRLILIPCNRVFQEEEQDKNLIFKLEKELSGIFNWATDGLLDLFGRGYFERKDFMKEAVADLREESNPIEVFFKEHIVKEDKGEIIKSEVYEKYVAWCKNNGNMALSMVKFGRIFYAKYSKYTPKSAQSFIHGKRIWRNLIYIDLIQPQGQQVTWQNE